MADIQLRVRPDVLKKKADELGRQIGNAERNWNRLCSVVRASKHYWEGDAGDCGRRLLEGIEEDVGMVFRRLREHPSDLLQMAGVYIDTEAKASELASTLPDDVIQ